MVYSMELASYISRHGMDRQAFLDAFPIQKEPEKTRKQTATARSGYRQRTDLSNDELATVVDMYRKGAKIRNIAGKFNVRQETVNKILNLADVARRRKPTRRVNKSAAVEMLLAGMSVPKVAEVLECSEHTISEYRRELIQAGRS